MRVPCFAALILFVAGSWLSLAVAKPLRPTAESARGVLVLDNCDPDYKDKPEYEDCLTSIDGRGRLSFRVSKLNNCESIGSNHMIAADDTRDCVWIIENVGRNLRKFNRAGKEMLIVRDVSASALAVDPETGNVWVVTSTAAKGGGKTIVFDPHGKELATYDISGWDIAYDAKGKAFWIAGNKLGKISADKGEIVFQKDIAAWCASSVDVHSNGTAWVAVRAHPEVANSNNELLVFAADGTLKHQVPLGDAIPFRVSVDPRTGAGWVTIFRRGVRRYAPDGKLEREFPVHALAAHAESEQGGVWVVTPHETVLLSPRGENQATVTHKRTTSQAWIAGW